MTKTETKIKKPKKPTRKQIKKYCNDRMFYNLTKKQKRIIANALYELHCEVIDDYFAWLDEPKKVLSMPDWADDSGEVLEHETEVNQRCKYREWVDEYNGRWEATYCSGMGKNHCTIRSDVYDMVRASVNTMCDQVTDSDYDAFTILVGNGDPIEHFYHQLIDGLDDGVILDY